MGKSETVTGSNFFVSSCLYRHNLPESDHLGVTFAVKGEDIVCTPGKSEEPSESIKRVFCNFQGEDYRTCPVYALERFAHAWGLVRRVFPEDGVSTVSERPGIGVRCTDDTSPFSYGSSLRVNFDIGKVLVLDPKYNQRAEKLIQVLNEDNTFGKFSLE